MGKRVESFIKTGPDHYGHATSYFKIACDSLVQNVSDTAAKMAPTAVASFKTQGVQSAKPVSPMSSALGSIFS